MSIISRLWKTEMTGNKQKRTWNENALPKKNSVCASAVFDQFEISNFDGRDTFGFLADACGGQNKNQAMIYMAEHWMS